MRNSTLFKEYDYFYTQFDNLIKEHEGKFALVKDERIVNIFNTRSEADDHVKKESWEFGTYLIQPIAKKELRVIAYSPV